MGPFVSRGNNPLLIKTKSTINIEIRSNTIQPLSFSIQSMVGSYIVF